MPHAVSELLDHSSQRFGAQPFLSVGEKSCLSDELVQQVSNAASLLLARDLQTGRRSAGVLPRTNRVAVLWLASMLAVGLAVPVHGKLKAVQGYHVIEGSTPRFVITSTARTVALGAKVVGDCFALGTAGHMLALLPDSFDDGLNHMKTCIDNT